MLVKRYRGHDKLRVSSGYRGEEKWTVYISMRVNAGIDTGEVVYRSFGRKYNGVLQPIVEY